MLLGGGIAAKPSKVLGGPEFQSLRGVFRGVFLLSEEGYGGVFKFPRLFEEYCGKNSCIT